MQDDINNEIGDLCGQARMKIEMRLRCFLVIGWVGGTETILLALIHLEF